MCVWKTPELILDTKELTSFHSIKVKKVEWNVVVGGGHALVSLIAPTVHPE